MASGGMGCLGIKLKKVTELVLQALEESGDKGNVILIEEIPALCLLD